MTNFEVGTFLFNEDELIKTIDLNNTYENNIVVKLTPQNSNVNVFLVNVYQNNRFTVVKNSNENVTVNYVVIESKNSGTSAVGKLIGTPSGDLAGTPGGGLSGE